MLSLHKLDKCCESHFSNQMSLKESTDESGWIKRASPLEILGIKYYRDEDLIFPIVLWEALKGKTYPPNDYMDRL